VIENHRHFNAVIDEALAVFLKFFEGYVKSEMVERPVGRSEIDLAG
jgi:hypothetical protein